MYMNALFYKDIMMSACYYSEKHLKIKMHLKSLLLIIYKQNLSFSFKNLVI